MAKATFIVNDKTALNHKIEGVVHVDVAISRRFIWIMKLQYVWAVIRAKVQ